MNASFLDLGAGGGGRASFGAMLVQLVSGGVWRRVRGSLWGGGCWNSREFGPRLAPTPTEDRASMYGEWGARRRRVAVNCCLRLIFQEHSGITDPHLGALVSLCKRVSGQPLAPGFRSGSSDSQRQTWRLGSEVSLRILNGKRQNAVWPP